MRGVEPSALLRQQIGEPAQLRGESLAFAPDLAQRAARGEQRQRGIAPVHQKAIHHGGVIAPRREIGLAQHRIGQRAENLGAVDRQVESLRGF
jgi:hypothetical protein